jgi:hypothetical protein
MWDRNWLHWTRVVIERCESCCMGWAYLKPSPVGHRAAAGVDALWMGRGCRGLQRKRSCWRQWACGSTASASTFVHLGPSHAREAEGLSLLPAPDLAWPTARSAAPCPTTSSWADVNDVARSSLVRLVGVSNAGTPGTSTRDARHFVQSCARTGSKTRAAQPPRVEPTTARLQVRDAGPTRAKRARRQGSSAAAGQTLDARARAAGHHVRLGGSLLQRQGWLPGGHRTGAAQGLAHSASRSASTRPSVLDATQVFSSLQCTPVHAAVAPDGAAGGLQGWSGWQIPLLAIQAAAPPSPRGDARRCSGTSESHQGTARPHNRAHTL